MRLLLTLLMAAAASLNVACASTAYGTGGYDRHDDRYRYDDRYHYRHGDREDSIARAAYELELAADQFYGDLRHVMGNRHTAKDARHFAREARQFHRSVQRDRHGHRLYRDFQELEREYRQVQYLFGGYDRRGRAHHRGRYGYGGFDRVERAFARLEHAFDRSYRHGHDRRYERYGQRDERYSPRHGASLALRIERN